MGDRKTDWDVIGACAELVGAALGNELAVNTLMTPNLAKPSC